MAEPQKTTTAGVLLAITAFVAALTPLVVAGPEFVRKVIEMYRALGMSDVEIAAHIRASELDVHLFDDWLQQYPETPKHPGSQIPG